MHQNIINKRLFIYKSTLCSSEMAPHNFNLVHLDIFKLKCVTNYLLQQIYRTMKCHSIAVF